MQRLKKNDIYVVLAGIGLLISYGWIFIRFIPNKRGMLGHDYTYYLPILLDDYIWYLSNGLWSIPWFTPSFCGGSLNYTNLQSVFYSLPGFITFLTDPLTAVQATLIIFAGLGALGFYLLLNAFYISRPVAFFGAALFLFNGFYTHKMLIGHLGHHSFMLIPLVAFILLRPLQEDRKKRSRQIRSSFVTGGLLLAYMVHSGFLPLMLPAIISLVLIGLIHGIFYGNVRDFWLRLGGAGLVSALLSISKLTAAYYLTQSFSRSAYKLPGAKSFLGSLILLTRSLFISPSIDSTRLEALTNLQWHLGRHEWEYSVTFVPLLIILYGGWKLLHRAKIKSVVLETSRRKWLQVGAIVVLLFIPIALNTYSPSWNAILKKIPVIKSSSSLIRWFIIYIPAVILAAALVLEKTVIRHKHKVVVLIISLFAVVAINAFTDRTYYSMQNYDPKEIVQAYYNIKAGLFEPKIEGIGVYVDKKGQRLNPIFNNNLLVYKASSLFCYEAQFGYRLEDLPIKTLHAGSVLEENAGVFNIKNPACYIWPEANNCEPGDHFKTDKKSDVLSFITYRPFDFKIPLFQKIANWINLLALVVVVLFFLNRLYHMAGIALKKAGKIYGR